MFGYTIERDGAPAVLIFVRRAAENQMTLYYQTCSASCVAWSKARLAVPLTMRRWHRINAALTALACSSRLPLAKSSRPSRRWQMARWAAFCSCAWYRAWTARAWWAQWVGNPRERRGGLGRWRRALPAYAPGKGVRSAIIRERLSTKQIAVEPVDGEDIVALLQHIADTGDGEGGAA